MATKNSGQDRLKSASNDLVSTLGSKALSVVGDRVTGLTDRLEDVASGNSPMKSVLGAGKSAAEGESPVKGALKGAASAVKDKIPGLGSGGSGKSGGSPKATKATNIIEDTDVGVPVRVAYNQWTEFDAFPSFMKKVEKVDAEEDEKLEWKAQIVWSHRTWSATILEQIPDERIVWRSQGEKGHVDGAVTFHELGPNLTRILVVLEYYPQGLFERTGNIWRAQGRRARVELKHFRRHVMTRTILNPDEVEGWRGRIEDSEVVETHEDAVEREEQEREESDDQGEDQYDEESDEGSEDEYEDEPEEEYEDEPVDESVDESDEESDEEPEDEYEEESADEESDDEAAYEDEDDSEEAPTGSRRRRAS
jgi:Polyketide cyclase / dehydrase and lipid transport